MIKTVIDKIKNFVRRNQTEAKPIYFEKGIVRQGELLLTSLKKITPNEGNVLVLATDHMTPGMNLHIVKGSTANLYKVGYETYLHVIKDAKIEHPGHLSIVVKPGMYLVEQQGMVNSNKPQQIDYQALNEIKNKFGKIDYN
jgi:hypothetical protein